MRKFASLLILLATSAGCAAGQDALAVVQPQKGDTFATDEHGRKFRIQHGELAKGNFQIAGMDLAREEDVSSRLPGFLAPLRHVKRAMRVMRTNVLATGLWIGVTQHGFISTLEK